MSLLGGLTMSLQAHHEPIVRLNMSLGRLTMSLQREP